METLNSFDTVTLDETTVEPYAFTAWDRCDGGITEQAYHRATKGDQTLLLCYHHYNLAETTLLTDGWTVESDIVALEKLGVKNYIYSEQ